MFVGISEHRAIKYFVISVCSYKINFLNSNIRLVEQAGVEAEDGITDLIDWKNVGDLTH